MTFSKYVQSLARNDKKLHTDRFKSLNNADEIILASREYINEGLKHERKDNIRDFARVKVLIRVGSNDYEAEVIVCTTSSNVMLLDDVINMKKTTIKEKTDKSYSLKEDYRRDLPAYSDSIREQDTKSNKNFC